MEDKINIENIECYLYARNRGYEPLIDKRFHIDFELRMQIQYFLFGKGHTPQQNEKFYKYCWNIYPHYCQECMKPLRNYSAVYISHIITKAAYPELAHDVRNINILCYNHHNQWENGNRKIMRIYQQNLRLIELLKNECSKFNYDI